jgi:hypothetical protein
MLAHAEWVNARWYESLSARGRPANPARDTYGPIVSPSRRTSINGGSW